MSKSVYASSEPRLSSKILSCAKNSFTYDEPFSGSNNTKTCCFVTPDVISTPGNTMSLSPAAAFIASIPSPEL